MRSSSLALIGLSLVFTLACGGGEKPAETTTPPPPPPPTTAPAATTGGTVSIGVPECDDYLKKVEECVGKMDATTKAAYESGQKQVTDAWVTAAATPEGKSALAPGCKAALDAYTCPATDAAKDAASGSSGRSDNDAPPPLQGRSGEDAEGHKSRPGSLGGSDDKSGSGSGSNGAGGSRSRPK